MQKLLADNEEMNFLHENKTEAKDQLQQASQPSHDSPFNNSVNNWSMQGSSFKQNKLSQSLENNENCT